MEIHVGMLTSIWTLYSPVSPTVAPHPRCAATLSSGVDLASASLGLGYVTIMLTVLTGVMKTHVYVSGLFFVFALTILI